MTGRKISLNMAHFVNKTCLFAFFEVHREREGEGFEEWVEKGESEKGN